MEIFWTDDISGNLCRLSEEEAAHAVRVLRHRAGDTINVIDGQGTMYECEITEASPKAALVQIVRTFRDWRSHGYNLVMAVCPTKNIDRYEWFAEKATEFGVDRIVPVIGMHSERKVLKTERLRKILLSAAKQSLKARIPELSEPVSVMDFIKASAAENVLKLIAYCFEDENVPRRSVKEVLENFQGREVMVLIGPEGDFSKEEAEAAVRAGFVPVHLGASRLRTETAALAAVSMVYYNYTE